MAGQGFRNAVVVALAFLLTGCVTEPPSPTITTAAPTPSASYVQPERPQTRVGFDCADAVGVLDIPAALGGGATTIDPMIGTRGGVIESLSRVRTLAIEQAGGVWCAWELPDSQETTTFKLTVVPDAPVGAWEAQIVAQSVQPLPGIDGEGWILCGSDGPFCFASLLVAGTWAEISLTTFGTPEAPEGALIAAAQKLSTAITAADPMSPLWQPPSAARLASCADVVPDGADLPVFGAVAAWPEGGTPSAIEKAAGVTAALLDCGWLPVEGGGSLTYLRLPGGAWAWGDRPPQSNGSITLAPADGLGDAAYTGCAETISSCLAHVLDGEDWVVIDSSAHQTGDEFLALVHRLLEG